MHDKESERFVNLPVKSLSVLALLLTSTMWAAGPSNLESFNLDVHKGVLEQGSGKVILINFWATWCAPCREEMPHLAELQKKLGDKGFMLVTVSADEQEDAASALAFLQKYDVPGRAYLKSVDDDDAFIDAIDSKWSGALPALFLYDRNGKLARKFIGETDVDVLTKAIEALL